MPVYIDNAENPLGRMIMSHMYSESLEELHSMAAHVGLKRIWFQDKKGFPHYDISKTRKKEAIKNGAIEITTRELVKLVQKNRGNQNE